MSYLGRSSACIQGNGLESFKNFIVMIQCDVFQKVEIDKKSTIPQEVVGLTQQIAKKSYAVVCRDDTFEYTI